MTIVTGASGFIGQALLSAGPHLVGITRDDADLRDRRATLALFDRLRPTRVIHLAALTGGVQFQATRHAEVALTNTQIDANVLDAAVASGVTRLIALVSSCAYPDFERPVSEHDLHSGAPHPGSAGMGVAKRHLDQLCRTLSSPQRLFTTITPVTVYGAGDSSDHTRAHVIPALIDRAWEARRTGDRLQVWGTGTAVRQFLHINDLVPLLLDEVRRDEAPPTMIVAPDDGCTIAALAETIADTVGLPARPQYTGEMEGQRRKLLRSAVFAARHPGAVFTPFDTGLRDAVRSSAHAC